MNETCDELVDHNYLGYFKHAGKLWYLVDPYETTFENHQNVPDYHNQVNLYLKKKTKVFSCQLSKVI